jgi:hypothetical protein
VAISLPHATICKISSHPALLSILDLENTRRLWFCSYLSNEIMFPQDIPSQLTELELVGCSFETSAIRRAQYFPVLEALSISSARLYGTLQEYFVVPELRRLLLRNITIFDVNGNCVTRPFSCDFFRCDIPKLASLHLLWLELDDGPTTSLK